MATMELVDRVPGEEVEVALTAPPGITVETPPLSVRDESTAYWRIRAEREGRYDLVFRVGDEEIRKEVLVQGRPVEAEHFQHGFGTGGGASGGGGLADPGGTVGGVWKAAPAASRASFTEALLYPGERPLPRGSVVKRVEVQYPAYRFTVGRHGFHWLVVFCVISLAFGFSLKPMLRVE